MSTLSQAPPDFLNKYPEHSTDVNRAPVDLRAPRPPRLQRLQRYPIYTLLRFVIAVGIGVGGGWVWHTYSDMARQMAATAYPGQLSWLMPPPSSTAPAVPVAAAPAGAAAATVSAAAPATAFDQEQLNAVSLGLAGVRRSVEELAAQIATVATGQQQMASDIARLQARLQASEEDVAKITSAPPSRSAARVHRPARPHMTRAPTAAPPAGSADKAGNLGGVSAEAGHDVERNWLGIIGGQPAAR